MKNLKLFLVATAAFLFIMACEKDENGNRVTYYKTIGEGYIWDEENNRPLEGVKITVISFTGVSDEWFSWAIPSTQESFTTDEKGYYQLRFAKRVGVYKVEKYGLILNHIPPLPPPLFGFGRDQAAMYDFLLLLNICILQM